MKKTYEYAKNAVLNLKSKFDMLKDLETYKKISNDLMEISSIPYNIGKENIYRFVKHIENIERQIKNINDIELSTKSEYHLRQITILLDEPLKFEQCVLYFIADKQRYQKDISFIKDAYISGFFKDDKIKIIIKKFVFNCDYIKDIHERYANLDSKMKLAAKKEIYETYHKIKSNPDVFVGSEVYSCHQIAQAIKQENELGKINIIMQYEINVEEGKF
jgi:hypothetical protein